MHHLLNSIPIYFSISAFHSEIRGVCFRNNTRAIPPFKLTIPLTCSPNLCPFPLLAVMTRLFSVRDTINVHWRVLALFGVFIDYSISRPEATHQRQQQHRTQDNNTNLLWKKSQVDAQWRCRGLHPPASRYTLVQPVFQFYFKIQNVFFSFCLFFLFFRFFCCFDSGFVCLCLHSFCADFLGDRSVTQMQSDSESDCESESWRASSSSSLSSSSNFQSLCLY